MKLIIHLILLLILLLCAWSGWKRGLILGVGSLLALVISVYSADLLSTTYSYEVLDALRPFASGYLETTINNKVRPEYNIVGAAASSLSVEDYLAAHPEDAEGFCQSAFEHMGIYKETARSMASSSLSYAESQEVSVNAAMTEVLCRSVAYAVGFLLAFLLILILLTVVGNLSNLTFKIPGMDALNDVGGLITGLVQGAFFCVLIVWVMKFTGILLPQEKIAESGVLAWVMRADLLYPFLGI